MATYADLSVVADRTWNDLVVDGRGNAYVNGISFSGENNRGLVALVTLDGVARQVADGLAFPNGMAVTPDNGTLVVADSYAQQLVAFDIARDGALSNRRAWADVAGHPDGICIDAEDAVWYADVGDKQCVRVAHGGRVHETVQHDRGWFACVLGGPARTTLFVTAAQWEGWEKGVAAGTGQLVATEVSVPGAGWP